MRLFIASAIFLLFQIGYSQTDEKLNSHFQKKFEKTNLVGLQVAYVTKDKIWQGNYGLKEYGTINEVEDKTLFMIASSSKPVTAFGVLKLMEQGKIKLDDPVNKHLSFEVTNPHFEEKKITIRMLLAHVSSLRDHWEVMNPLYTLDEGGDSPIPLQEFVSEYVTDGGQYNTEFSFWNKTPGTKRQYSNVGYALLGVLIEEVSGMPFNEFIQQEVFEPIGMNDSYWLLANIPHTNIARPHDVPNDENGLKEPKPLTHYGYPDYPDGQIRTTASDYGRFLQMILNKGKANGQQIAKPETIEEFLRIQFPEVAEHQAVAWNYNEFDHWLYYILMPRLPAHTGFDPGVATAVSFDPEKGTAAILFSNSHPVGFSNQKNFYQEMMKKLLKAAEK